MTSVHGTRVVDAAPPRRGRFACGESAQPSFALACASRSAWRRWLASALAVALASTAPADETAIRAELKKFFSEKDASQRREIVARIEEDANYDPAKLRTWLHGCGLFEPMDAGRSTLSVSTGQAQLSVSLRIPKDYDCARPWPMLYVLHGTGGDGDGILDFVERLLGARVDEFVLAAPANYQQVVIKPAAPDLNEHRVALAAIRTRVHVDSDRVYALGYSRGGHACWTLAIAQPDEFAAIMPLAGTLLIPEYDKLFDAFLPNSSVTNVVCLWGAQDRAGPDGVAASPQGGIAAVNRLVFNQIRSLKLDHLGEELPDKGHGGITPGPAQLDSFLRHRRERAPRSLRHTFRVLEQGQTCWVETLKRSGPEWDEKPLEISLRPGEDGNDPGVQREALARAIRGRLSEIRVDVEEQTLRVSRKNVKSLVVWIGDEWLDWDRALVLKFSGRTVFEGVLKRNLGLCLEQARQTRDFERLRWAGLICDSGPRAKQCTAEFNAREQD